MVHLTNPPSGNKNLMDGIPRGTSESSNILNRTALHSVKEIDPGTGSAGRSLYQVAMRTVIGFYYSSPGDFFSIRDIKEVNREAILPVLSEIYNLLTWPDNWNGYGASAPKYEAVCSADHWIELLYQEVMESGLDWIEPNVTASAEGEVVFEWRHDEKRLTIYGGTQNAEYVKDWGPDIDTEMEDGYADSPDIRKSLWKWLMG